MPLLLGLVGALLALEASRADFGPAQGGTTLGAGGAQPYDADLAAYAASPDTWQSVLARGATATTSPLLAAAASIGWTDTGFARQVDGGGAPETRITNGSTGFGQGIANDLVCADTTTEREILLSAEFNIVRMAEDVNLGWSNTTSGYNDATVVAQYGGEVTLADGVTTTVLVIALNSGQRCGGTIHYTIDSTDAVEHQSVAGVVTYSAVNKSAAYTTSIGPVSESVAVSAGTLTTTWSMTTGSNLVNVRLNANTSLTPSTFLVRVHVVEGSSQGVTIQ